ncbi:MAG: hypothetical protein KC519_17175, partial [Anaerolineae bacterium]|nr:hypothetical protein [Anaerolineae bacterium]
MRNSVDLARLQIRAGQFDGDFLERHFDKMNSFVERAEQEHRLLKREQRFEALYNVTGLIGSSLEQ